MPLKWEELTSGAPDETGAPCVRADGRPCLRLTLWPHRSLPRKGFAAFILITYAMFLLPLMAFLGTAALWGMLPFMLATLALVWFFLQRSYADGALREVLTLKDDRVELVRLEPRGKRLGWEANPHWVRVEILPEGGPVENYVTLRGNRRTVEIGAFLSPEERARLYLELRRALG